MCALDANTLRTIKAAIAALEALVAADQIIVTAEVRLTEFIEAHTKTVSGVVGIHVDEFWARFRAALSPADRRSWSKVLLMSYLDEHLLGSGNDKRLPGRVWK